MLKTCSVKWLNRHGACSDQVELFRATFGESVELTRGVIFRAIDVGLNLSWFAQKVLTAPALAEYKRVTAPALAEYERVKAQALAEYERVTAPALAEYERVKAPALVDSLGLPEEVDDCPPRPFRKGG